LKKGVESAWTELKKAFDSATSKFKWLRRTIEGFSALTTIDHGDIKDHYRIVNDYYASGEKEIFLSEALLVLVFYP
jgi:hypothetical protein